MSRRVWPVALVVVASITVAGLWFVQHTRSWLHAPIAQLTDVTIYEVPRGAAFITVLNNLQTLGVIEHPRELATWVRYMRPGFKLKAGEYELRPGMSPVDIAELFNSGKVLLHKVKIVEGSTVREMRKLLADEPALKTLKPPLSTPVLLKQLNSTYSHPEGLFFPDTYHFPKDTTEVELLRVAYERMNKELESAWSGRDTGLPLASPYEALILASIVEKETGLASERALIAGVFIERLRRGMRLETDPTIIYGMGDRFDGDLRFADLRRDTPYNTRTRAGLPPTPICLPSAASINAAVHPKETGALFFVATGKGDGSSYFSKTLAEHNAALQRYLRTLKK